MKKRKPWQHRTQWRGETVCARSTPQQRLNICLQVQFWQLTSVFKHLQREEKMHNVKKDVFTFEHLLTLCLLHELQLGPQAFPGHPIPMAVNWTLPNQCSLIQKSDLSFFFFFFFLWSPLVSLRAVWGAVAKVGHPIKVVMGHPDQTITKGNDWDSFPTEVDILTE